MAKKRKLSRRGIIVISSTIFLIVAIVVTAFSWKQYTYRFGRAIDRKGTIRVATGTTFEELTRMLTDSGYLADPDKWVSFARSFDRDSVRAGNYALTEGLSYRTALTRFYFGQQTPVRITFNNIRTMERLAGAVSRFIEADSAQLLTVLKNTEIIEEHGFTPATFPALFIPNTYEVYWTLTPEGFVERMRKEYDRFWNDERKAQAEKLGYTPVEISTLAAIVAEETNLQREMTDVAGVYINRLRKGILLQADPTVKFALGDPSIRRVLHRHLTYDSPYNTYVYSGLPPGPICVPPIQAIDAVLAYADEDKKHDYYYFCANADFSGAHVFARTLSEHNRNAAAYSAELNRRGIR